MRVVVGEEEEKSEYHRSFGKRHRGSGNGTVESNQPMNHLNQTSSGDR